jgi:hypothetical protein
MYRNHVQEASLATIVLLRREVDGPLLRDGKSFVRLADIRLHDGEEFEECEEFEESELLRNPGAAILCYQV